ncbi:MAG: helix-turn-helix transcriptional regulator [Acidimicrobiia bacterium]|nr:helix-turn-helix transcriptional regulator [Acidimicrobiia bacterium]
MRRWTVRSSEDLGRAVAELRHSRGITQAELADQAGIGRTWLAKLEQGRRNNTVDHLLRLLRRMGATVTITWDDADAPT